jgi:hypothetical protein
MVTRDYRMSTADALLRRGLVDRGDAFDLTLDPAFQGLPDTAHGGTVLAAFHAIAAPAGPATLRGQYLRRVPLDVPLQVIVARHARAVTCRLLDRSGAVLVDGAVEQARGPQGNDGGLAVGGAQEGLPLPLSLRCFVCGTDNAIGLQARLAHDAHHVRGTWTPGPPLVASGGRLAPIALTSLLDEAAFWLGALASGESGMTTALEVEVAGDVAAGPITVQGRRDRVRARAGDRRYWDTEIEACDPAGRRVARARITFVAVRGAARRLVTGMLGINPPEIVARVFPAYCS